MKIAIEDEHVSMGDIKVLAHKYFDSIEWLPKEEFPNVCFGASGPKCRYSFRVECFQSGIAAVFSAMVYSERATFDDQVVLELYVRGHRKGSIELDPYERVLDDTLRHLKLMTLIRMPGD